MTADTPAPRDAPEPPESMLPTREGMRIMRCLAERGNSMRLKPLLRSLDMDIGTFVANAIDLQERCWIKLEWRTPVPDAEEIESRPHTDIDRLVVTWFGRWKWRRVWWMV